MTTLLSFFSKYYLYAIGAVIVAAVVWILILKVEVYRLKAGNAKLTVQVSVLSVSLARQNAAVQAWNEFALHTQAQAQTAITKAQNSSKAAKNQILYLQKKIDNAPKGATCSDAFKLLRKNLPGAAK